MARTQREIKRKRAAFKAALALEHMTQKAFAASRGVTEDHLVFVLRGMRESPRLMAEVDALVAKHLPQKAVA